MHVGALLLLEELDAADKRAVLRGALHSDREHGGVRQCSAPREKLRRNILPIRSAIGSRGLSDSDVQSERSSCPISAHARRTACRKDAFEGRGTGRFSTRLFFTCVTFLVIHML